jgi:hypothetical protein
MTWRVFASAMAIVCLSSSIANSQTRIFARVGGWESFGGLSNIGRAVCGISSRGPGKYFGLKYFAGNDSVTIQLGSASWQVRSSVRQRVVLRFDQAAPWNGVATGIHFGNGEAGLEFNIRRGQLDQFMREFRGSSSLLIGFPESSASAWRADLRGTDTISGSLVRCIRAMH